LHNNKGGSGREKQGLGGPEHLERRMSKREETRDKEEKEWVG
jgi:hypothetical protein